MVVYRPSKSSIGVRFSLPAPKKYLSEGKKVNPPVLGAGDSQFKPDHLDQKIW